MMLFAPLLAAAENWLSVLVPIVMMTIWVINRLFGGESPAARQKKAMQRARPNPPQPAGEKQRLEDEVGEFLRRAAQQRTGKEPGPAAPANQPPRPPRPARKPMPQLSDERGNGGPGSAQESEAPIKTRRLATTLSDERPQSTLSDRAVAPQEVTQAVETMQSHLSQTFDHQIGRLGRPMDNDEAAVAPAVSAAARTESPATAPGEMAAMLRDLSNIRDAIVVSEILRRPEERW